MVVDHEYNKVAISEKNVEKEDVPYKYGYGVRHVQVIIFLLCLTVNIIGRGHMGVTIVAMTVKPELNVTSISLNKSDRVFLNHSSHNLTDTGLQLDVNKSADDLLLENTATIHKIYDWPKSIQEVLLNAFFFGYMIMMFPMGMICQRYGGKLPLQVALCINGVVSIITPWVTSWGDWKGLCCCRLLQGLSQAGTYPSIQNLVARWAPADERATLGGCVHTGLTVGTIIAFQLAGFLGASKWGWPSTFYAVGLICLSCFTVLTIFGAANPLAHKSITNEEVNYIMGASNDGDCQKLKTPWRAIVKSKPVWGTWITHTGFNAAYVFFFNQVPTYLHYSLGIDVKNSGMLSSLPYMVSIFFNLFFGWMADYCTRRKILSKNNTRRISNSIASFGMVGCFLLTSYSSNITVVMIFLIIATCACMGSSTGWMVNYVDLAPNFTSSILATGNTLSNILVVLTPVAVSYVVTDMTNITQWRTMFFVTAGVSAVTNCIFLVLMSTDVQPWNYANIHESCADDAQENSKTSTKVDDTNKNATDRK